MFVDASVLVALILKEEDAPELAGRMDTAISLSTSPIALFETVAVVMARRQMPRADTQQLLNAILDAASISVIAITPEIGRLALEAFERYGKGRGHPAQLNMGDCFAYACARALKVPLLYKGDDFGRTDLAAAM